VNIETKSKKSFMLIFWCIRSGVELTQNWMKSHHRNVLIML